MLGIPSYPILLPVFAVVGFIVASTSIYTLTKGNEEDDKDGFRLLMLTFVGFIFLLVGTIGSIATVWSVYNFRTMNFSQVKAFRVIKAEDEYKNDNSNFVYYDDAASIQNILMSLKNCSETSRNHESYQDGYKFQIIFTDESLEKDFYISVYRKSSVKKGKSVVIPHYYENKNLNLGEYSCPTFQDWVRTNIDPLFENNKNQSK